MNKEIENLIKRIALTDLELALYQAKKESYIVPDLIFEIINEEKKKYEQHTTTEN